jgi:branched-chain amino acid aminotransferase
MGEGEGGAITLAVRKWLMDIMYGNEDHPWAVVIPEEA